MVETVRARFWILEASWMHEVGYGGQLDARVFRTANTDYQQGN